MRGCSISIVAVRPRGCRPSSIAAVMSGQDTRGAPVRLDVERELEARCLYEQRGTPTSRSAERFALQAGAVSLATSKRYTRAVLPPAILACSSLGTPSRISARIFRDWGNVDSLCG